jgi:hypothetical protein
VHLPPEEPVALEASGVLRFGKAGGHELTNGSRIGRWKRRGLRPKAYPTKRVNNYAWPGSSGEPKSFGNF